MSDHSMRAPIERAKRTLIHSCFPSQQPSWLWETPGPLRPRCMKKAMILCFLPGDVAARRPAVGLRAPGGSPERAPILSRIMFQLKVVFTLTGITLRLCSGFFYIYINHLYLHFFKEFILYKKNGHINISFFSSSMWPIGPIFYRYFLWILFFRAHILDAIPGPLFTPTRRYCFTQIIPMLVREVFVGSEKVVREVFALAISQFGISMQPFTAEQNLFSTISLLSHYLIALFSNYVFSDV